jgi:hydrogenase expression/formation protein HypC
MCLAVPAQLVSTKGDEAVADLHGNRVTVNTLLVGDVKIGDWVLIHAGFAIQKLDYSEAQETFAILKDVEKASGDVTT